MNNELATYLNQFKRIAFQGALGAYSDMACREMLPNLETLPCTSFDDAFCAVREDKADLAMIPVDNTLAGRVADVHGLMPGGDLFIIAEHFQPIHHALLGLKGTKIQDLKHVHSHLHAIPQCKKIVKKLGLTSHVHADTADAAQEIAQKADPAHGAIASTLAALIYNLEILEDNVQDEDPNTTRFIILSKEPHIPEISAQENYITTLLFEVRNIPAALYKALGGFSTNGLSLAKLESYVDANFQAARFYCDIEGHPESHEFKLALEELGFYAKDVKFLGAYPEHEFRGKTKADHSEIQK